MAFKGWIPEASVRKFVFRFKTLNGLVDWILGL